MAQAIGEVMTPDPITVSATATVAEAAGLMRDNGIEDGKAVGIVSLGDLAIERDQASVLAHISAAPANT